MSCEQYLIQSFMWRQCVAEDHFKTMATKCLKGIDLSKICRNFSKIIDFRYYLSGFRSTAKFDRIGSDGRNVVPIGDKSQPKYSSL